MGKMKAAAAAAEERSPEFIVPDLTPQQKEMRSKGLGGSDAERIMSGDWYQLWAEKTKRLQPEDLTRVLPVQMGKGDGSLQRPLVPGADRDPRQPRSFSCRALPCASCISAHALQHRRACDS